MILDVPQLIASEPVLEEEPPVSLCMAAACQYQDNPAIVVCRDKAGTRGDTKSDDIEKLREVGTSVVLLAGNMSLAKAVCAECAPAIRGYKSGSDDLAATKLKMGLQEAVRKRKRNMADALVSTRFGLSFDEVFNFSNANPGNSFYTQIWNAIERLNLGAELTVATFTDDEALLLYVSQEGEVIWTDHYCASGTGSQIAMAFLNQRPYNDLMDVEECLFRVLEAKVAAEKNPHVGRETVVCISTPSSLLCMVDPKYVEQLIRIIEKRRDEIPPLGFDPKFVRPYAEVIQELSALGDAMRLEISRLEQENLDIKRQTSELLKQAQEPKV